MAFSLSLAMALTSASAVFAANPTINSTEYSSLPVEFTQGSSGTGGVAGVDGEADGDITIVSVPTANLNFTMDPKGVGEARKLIGDLQAIQVADINDYMTTAAGGAITTADDTDIYTFATGVTITRDKLNLGGTTVKIASRYDEQDIYNQLCAMYKGKVKGTNRLDFTNNGKNPVKIGVTVQATTKDSNTNAEFLDKTTYVDTNTSTIPATNADGSKNTANQIMLRFDPDANKVVADSENLLADKSAVLSSTDDTDTAFSTTGKVKYYDTAAEKAADTDKEKKNQIVYTGANDNGAIFDANGSKIDFTMAGDYSYGVPFSVTAPAGGYKYVPGEKGFSTDADALLKAAEATDIAGTTTTAYADMKGDLGASTPVEGTLVTTKATHIAFKISGEVNSLADWTKYAAASNPEMQVGCKAVYTVSAAKIAPEGTAGITAGEEDQYVENLNYDGTASTQEYVKTGSYKSGAAASASFAAAKTEFASADTEITFKFTGGDLTKETLSNSYFMIGNQDIWLLKSGTLKTTFNDGTNGKFDTAAGTLMIKRSFLQNATYNANFAPVVGTLADGTTASKKYTVKVKDSNGKEYTAEANVGD